MRDLDAWQLRKSQRSLGGVFFAKGWLVFFGKGLARSLLVFARFKCCKFSVRWSWNVSKVQITPFAGFGTVQTLQITGPAGFGTFQMLQITALAGLGTAITVSAGFGTLQMLQVIEYAGFGTL